MKISYSKKPRLKISIAIVLAIFEILLITAPLFTSAIDDAPILTSMSYNISTEVVSTTALETNSFVPSKYAGILSMNHHGDYGNRPELHHFIDFKGLYNIAYADSKNVYVDRLTESFELVNSVTIPRLFPMFGDITCDDNGYMYIIWGQADTAGKGGIATVSASKYDYNGKLIATTGYTADASDKFDCREPFKAGNCHAIVTSDHHLVCSFAKLMYSGHQANGVIDIDTKTMKRTDRFGNYVSHSFDQRVIELADNGLCFVNKGDAYPRGYDLDFYYTDREDEVSFHFYGASGDNNVYSWLGGLVDVNSRLYLVGSSARSLTADAANEPQDLFIQLVGDESKSLDGSEARFGSSCDRYVRDYNIIWLTRCVAPYTVSNPQVVAVDSSRFVVMWEEYIKGASSAESEFVQSYYMIIDENGEVVRDKDVLGGHLNTHEDPIYHKGSIYWCTAGIVGKVTKEVTIDGVKYAIAGYGIQHGDTVTCNKLSAIQKRRSIDLEAPNLIEVVASGSGIKINWEKVMNAPKYKVLRDDGNGAWHAIATTSNTYYIDTTGVGGKTYRYTVCCTDSAGKEELSDYDIDGMTVICTSFGDIPVGSWYEKPVTYCVTNSLFSGTGPNSFSPNASMTRAMLVQVLYALDGSPAVTPVQRFNDVATSAWYAKSVEWAYSNSITGGVSKTEFAPGAYVTREQFATFLTAYAKYKGVDTSEAADLSAYTDAPNIHSWAKTAVEWAVARKLISGTSSSTLSPGGVATRAQAATMFKTLCENVLK